VRLHLVTIALIAAATAAAAAHVGTSNAYFEGAAGPYGIRVIVRTPGVIPGLAQASVRILSGGSAERVTMRPLRSDVGLEGAPPADVAGPVRGEPDLFSGELWLMTAGSYSIEVTVSGAHGDGTVMVPVMAVAERSLEMHWAVGLGLAAAALFLFFGAVTIFGAAVRESVLQPGAEPDRRSRRRGRIATVLAAGALAGALSGGWSWWNAVDAEYRSRIYEPWSTTSAVDMTAGAAVLTLAIDDPERVANRHLPGAALLPDHGKLIHMFLVEADALSAFAHVHPAPAGEDVFEVALPPLPPGEYRIFADIVLENGFAPTLVDTVRVTGSAAAATAPAQPAEGAPPAAGPARDPDDSWAELQPRGASNSLDYALPSGRMLRWDRDGAVVADTEATLRFAARERDGSPAVLEPYMGMLSHAAVLRHDASVFVHLHPAGSINLTAQQRFEAAEGAGDGSAPEAAGHMRMHAPDGPADSVTFPFVFPQPGAWRLFVQVKIGGAVETAAFDVQVEDPAGRP